VIAWLAVAIAISREHKRRSDAADAPAKS
jgi:hypothetical protein